MNRANSWAFEPVLLSSFATLVLTVLLCRVLTKRKRVPSYGTLVGVPLTCACLVWIVPIFVDAWCYHEWYLLTPGYWQQSRAGFAGLYVPIGIIWATSILPAAAIVFYFQGRRKTDAPDVA